MVGKTNVTGERLRSIIAVTYPEGSICTCVSGTKTLKARDTSGKALFNVTVGEWTVKAEDTAAGKSKSVNVSITADGQIESVTLKYSLDVIVNGKFNTEVTGSWPVSESGSGAMAEKDGGYVFIWSPAGSYTEWKSAKKLPTSEYKTMYVDYSASLNGYSSQFISIGGVSVSTKSSSSDARNTRAVDISSLTSDYQMSLIARAWSGNGDVGVNIYNLYLE